jgi:REP element-mobilizing transposase RayT
MHGELGGIAKKLECNPIMIGGVEDHVHLLTTLSRTCKPAEFVKEVKRASSIWIKEEFEGYGRFQWQSGYGCFSIGQSQVEEICDYIANQEEHHKRVSFQDEFRTFLRQHEIEYDERYVWD